MHARSAVFDLYGDHLADRDEWAPISAIVHLLEAVDVAPAATRTAVSRMVREGWLVAQERDGVRGYAATERARLRLAAAWRRIYAVAPPRWDGRWHIVVADHISDRSRRSRLAASMAYLGYGRLSSGTWVAPRASEELAEALEGVSTRQFRSDFLGDGGALAQEVWDLAGLATAYREFLTWLDTVTTDHAVHPDLSQASWAYAVRTEIVHEWRKFLFNDPGLPPQVLPADWPGLAAAQTFLEVTTSLRPTASAYVDACLREAGAPSIAHT